MNKLVILLLAVCLVSVHAFVKRDAPKPAEGQDMLKEFLDNAQNKLKSFGDELPKMFDPEKMKTNFNDVVDKISAAIKPTQKTA